MVSETVNEKKASGKTRSPEVSSTIRSLSIQRHAKREHETYPSNMEITLYIPVIYVLNYWSPVIWRSAPRSTNRPPEHYLAVPLERLCSWVRVDGRGRHAFMCMCVCLSMYHDCRKLERGGNRSTENGGKPSPPPPAIIVSHFANELRHDVLTEWALSMHEQK